VTRQGNHAFLPRRLTRRRRSLRPLLLCSLSLALLLGGCVQTRRPASSPGPNRLNVVTTVAPVTLFTRAVAGDCAEVTSLLPPGAGPHGFQSRPSDLLTLRSARVLVINGLGLETFLDGLRRSAGTSSLRVIDSSRGVPLIAGEEPTLELKSASGHDHAHGDAGANPHVWLDPQRAARQVEAIRDGLSAADPGCAAGYRSRAQAYLDQLRRLDSDIATTLAPFRGRSFVVFHDFAPYFAARYGLRADFLVQSPEQAPSPADLQRVVEAVRRSGVRVLLSPPGERPGIFETLSRDLGVQVASFSPLEALSAAELADPATYPRLMRRNAEALQRGFTP